MIFAESNDTGVLKTFSVTDRIFDINHQGIMKKNSNINLMEKQDASTAAEMFSSVDTIFVKHGISWDFVAALGVDNTNANIGERNSLKSRALEKNHNIFITGCLCHILYNAACKYGSVFATVTGLDIEDHCVDLFYWFLFFKKEKHPQRILRVL